MPSGSTPLSISNQALSWLGANLITSFDDGSTEANLVKANYDQLRDAVLETYYWSFATIRVKLSATDPSPGEAYPGYVFPLPADRIRVWKASSDPEFRTGAGGNWVLESGRIVANFSPVFIKYTFRLEDTTRMSPGFTQALAARMATDLALPITESNRKLEAMQTLYGMKLSEAKTLDGMQGTNERIRSTWMQKSRSRTSNSTG